VAFVCSLAVGSNAAPGADTAEVVKRATAALNSDWASDPLYACVEKDEVQKGDRTTSKTFEVVMIDGSDYDLALATDDQPLSPERRKAELMKFKAEVGRRREESASARHARVEAWKKRRDENGELLLDFPTALTFQFQGEETKGGRLAYVFSATPKAGIVPATRAAKVLAGIQGKAWVDAATFHPMRVECTVVRPVPVFGALASVLPGTEIGIGMTPVSNSVWLVDEVSMRLSLSKLHVFKSTGLTRSTYSQYRPNSEVVAEFLAKAGEE